MLHISKLKVEEDTYAGIGTRFGNYSAFLGHKSIIMDLGKVELVAKRVSRKAPRPLGGRQLDNHGHRMNGANSAETTAHGALYLLYAGGLRFMLLAFALGDVGVLGQTGLASSILHIGPPT